MKTHTDDNKKQYPSEALFALLPIDISVDINGPPVMSPSKPHMYTSAKRRPLSSVDSIADSKPCNAGSRPSQKPAPSIAESN